MGFLGKIKDKITERIADKIENSFSLEDKQPWVNLKQKLELEKKLTVIEKEFRKQLYTFISSALGFVAALFWRDAIAALLKEFVPNTEEWLPRLLTAIIVSILAVVGILFIKDLLIKSKDTK